ncbi:hypothetical protein HDU96_001093 [Phlyctochytrium bullatum]|nr:hypothetical protein HDU96_001093 [Phlyctochytrium bullatum]
MISPLKATATLAAILRGLTSASAIPSREFQSMPDRFDYPSALRLTGLPLAQPSQNQTLVTLNGSASTYNECSFHRDAANLRCSDTFLPHNPPDGPTSGKCITASAAYGDVCIGAVNKNDTLPFEYAFRYPNTTDLGPSARIAAAFDAFDMDEGVMERAVNVNKLNRKKIEEIRKEMDRKIVYFEDLISERWGKEACKTPRDKAFEQCAKRFSGTKLTQCQNTAKFKFMMCEKAVGANHYYNFKMCFPYRACGGEAVDLVKPAQCKQKRLYEDMQKLCIFFYHERNMASLLKDCLRGIELEVDDCVKGTKKDHDYHYYFSPTEVPTWKGS